MSLLRSILHLLLMLVTVMPWAIVMLVASLRADGVTLYWMAVRWLGWIIDGARSILGIQIRVIGMENLPVGATSAAILLVKHQSTLETFLIPTLMPNPLAFVFKKELLRVPFFGWAIGRLDMIHIDRSQRNQAFRKVVEQGKDLVSSCAPASPAFVMASSIRSLLSRSVASAIRRSNSRLSERTSS